MRSEQQWPLRSVPTQARDEVRLAGLGMISTSNPSALKRGASSSAIWPSLPGGLLVFTRMSSTSSAAVGSSGALCARDSADATLRSSAEPHSRRQAADDTGM
jgi:hypothetical protein